MHPTLTHLALHVPDLDACIEFYQRYCAMRVIHERPGKGTRIVWMAEPGKEHQFIFVIMPGGVFFSGVRDLYAALELPYGSWPWKTVGAKKR